MIDNLFSLQGLIKSGPALRSWRSGWETRRNSFSSQELNLPQGNMLSMGYIIMQQQFLITRPRRVYTKWRNQIPLEYKKSVLGEQPGDSVLPKNVLDDPWCIGHLTNYDLLIPLARDARKPLFFLRPGDGAQGSYLDAAQKVYFEFKELMEKIFKRISLSDKIKSPPKALVDSQSVDLEYYQI
jgi:hypothetical protein